MFMDEARFGRINRPARCWAPPGVRPVIGCQVVREYTYAYTAVSPADGASCSLILPTMQTECFQAFLTTLSARFPDQLVVMICDGAGSHAANQLQVPQNIRLIGLPPYSPELNPVEQVWALIRERYFANKIMHSMSEVQQVLTCALNWLTDAAQALQSLTHRSWATTP